MWSALATSWRSWGPFIYLLSCCREVSGDSFPRLPGSRHPRPHAQISAGPLHQALSGPQGPAPQSWLTWHPALLRWSGLGIRSEAAPRRWDGPSGGPRAAPAPPTPPSPGSRGELGPPQQTANSILSFCCFPGQHGDRQ